MKQPRGICISYYESNTERKTRYGEEKVDLGAVAAGAGRNAKAFFEKTKDSIVKAVDQNDDGSVDLKDVSAIAETIGNAAKTLPPSLKTAPNPKAVRWN